MKKCCSLVVLAALLASILAACAIIEKPLTAAELLDLGDKYLLEMDYEQAVVYFAKLIEIDPMNPRGYTGLAETYAALGEIDKAESILKQGLVELPDNDEITKLLSEIVAIPESPITNEPPLVEEPVEETVEEPVEEAVEEPVEEEPLTNDSTKQVVDNSQTLLVASEGEILQFANIVDEFYELAWTEYNYKTSTPDEIISELICNGFDTPGYSYYIDSANQNYWAGPLSDPLKRLEYDHWKLPANEVDWIIENIFNSKANHNVETESLYYYDDNYYLTAGAAGYIGHLAEVRAYELLDSGKYYIVCDIYEMDYENESFLKGEYRATTYFVAGIKEIGGRRYWTFFAISNSPIDLNNT